MSSFSDSKALLNKAGQILQEIEINYPKYLMQQEASIELQISIKDFLDKVNPALDFSAFHIFSTFCIDHVKGNLERAKSKVYFPNRQGERDFNELISNTFPGLLKNRPDIVDVFRKYQPFPARSKWLSHLRELSNQNKHRNLSRQTLNASTHINKMVLPGRNVFENVTFTSPGNSIRSSINGQEFDFLSPQSIPSFVYFDGSSDLDFVFDDLDHPVLQTLQRIYRSAPSVIADLEYVLEEA